MVAVPSEVSSGFANLDRVSRDAGRLGFPARAGALSNSGMSTP